MASKSPLAALENYSMASKADITSLDFALYMDSVDPLRSFRKRFALPKRGGLPIDAKLSQTEEDEECIYFCGNSLGLMPLAAKLYQDEQMMKWAKLGVFTHFHGAFPAATCDQPGKAYTAEIVGAIDPSEVSIMNGLSVNLHLFLMAFYRPERNGRFKIMLEKQAFPSDRYALRSYANLAGFTEEEALIEIGPRPGEYTIRTEDILESINQNGDQLACVLFSGVQYYTGQKFDVPTITAAAKSKGAFVGWDLAHAVGNIKLELHNWNVDFAVWCTYKYLNSGAGGIAGAFLHLKYRDNPPAHLHGWFSGSGESRFHMMKDIELAPGADSFRLCNPPPFLACMNYASLEIFHEAGMDRIVQKQFLLTGYLEYLLKKYFDATKMTVLTSDDPDQRGCQLSLVFSMDLQKVHNKLEAHGVVCDLRKPNCMRIAPAPLYNSFEDVWKFVQILIQVTNESVEH